MDKTWIAYYLLIAGLLVWAAGRAWIPILLLAGIIGFSIYRFFKARDLEKVTSIVFTLLCILFLAGVHSNFLTGLLLFTVIVELAF